MAAKKTRKSAADSFRQQEEIFGILLMTLSLLVLISLVSYDPGEDPAMLKSGGDIKNAMGVIGIYISYSLIKMFIGYPAVVIPFLLFAWGWNRFRGNSAQPLARATLFVLALALYIGTILGLPHAANPGDFTFGFEMSGLLGGFVATSLYKLFGLIGSVIVLISVAMITIVGFTGFSFEQQVARIIQGFREIGTWVRESFGKIEIPKPEAGPKPAAKRAIRPSVTRTGIDDEDAQFSFRQPVPEPKQPPAVRQPQPAARPQQTSLPLDSRPASPPKATPAPATARQSVPPVDDENITVTDREDLGHVRTDDELPEEVPPRGQYNYPGLELLEYPAEQVQPVPKEELLANAKILEERLAEFGVDGNVVEINPGPVITRYEYEPAPGIKVSKITNLSDDLALAMRAKRIRIIAPIPGKAAVGIELPNRQPQMVYLRSIVDTELFRRSPSPLTIALGKNISGKPFITQLEKMPHMLVAGSTGSGKSVCLNAILASILYKAHPTDVQFVLIDPKRLELSLYNALHNHHLTYREDHKEPVITKADDALAALRSVEYEMELRYDLLAASSVRNIADYNERVKAGRITEGLNGEEALPLPSIVVIIDELADLMMTAAKEVEEPIARLTQMARAVGIHLIVATQRPSVDVITGVIKANFPARIAFAVASKTDSRTILDMNGADQLLGRGDMLFLPPNSPEAMRVHGAFVSTEEIEQILAFVQSQPRYPRKLLPVRPEETNTGGLRGRSGGERDVLFNEALKIVVRHQQGSISLLQRRLKVGYARAARLIDELEAAGIVGGFDGSKAREVLMSEEQLEDLDFSTL